MIKECKFCGKEFIATNASVYCSKCKKLGRDLLANKRFDYRKEQQCDYCGRTYTRNRKTKFCSAECRKTYANENTRTKRKWKKANKTCSICGVKFKDLQRSKYCSVECQKEARRIRGKNARRQRRAILKSVKVEFVDDRIVYERDKWICGICGEEVDKNKKHPHPLSASLDHIIPISKGGNHSYKNVQLAHFICNSTKRNNENYKSG